MRNNLLVRDLSFAAAIGVGLAFAATRLLPSADSARDREYEAKAAHRSQQGAAADTPVKIPVAGWIDIFRRTYHEVDRDRVRAVAAGVTFYALLALFHALTVFVSIYGLVAEPGTISGYNGRRPHQSLGRQTPDQAYFNALQPIPVAA